MDIESQLAFPTQLKTWSQFIGYEDEVLILAKFRALPDFSEDTYLEFNCRSKWTLLMWGDDNTRGELKALKKAKEIYCFNAEAEPVQLA